MVKELNCLSNITKVCPLQICMYLYFVLVISINYYITILQAAHTQVIKYPAPKGISTTAYLITFKYRLG